ncbi:MAG TPA: anthranilate synthase component I [Candidatus Hydrogenedentes bacterium]|jgi:anthranilate synthase component 1|nr:MAG: Anthranilate synthase component 1 [Candidatus Hydrogenedentes bacterium ADurb.Bin170]HOD95115.1 anthranilate synthase component I [Candidatus Hydrogenedentota bacterium]HOM48565.1 anthranilate synthase component I [Candidatus Hydrogenedentota bacterium]HOR51644.1 anthranilate synthase component I [Candidatus Hydrogenedentota bacterium]HPK26041.1 anthranilate synthase component I [Candidatus Hydrogenedentota bacterium]
MLIPSLDEFRRLAHQNAIIPVYKEILADLETPVTAYLKLSRYTPCSFLLESVEKAENIGQYSFIGANPSTVFRSKGEAGVLIENGVEHPFTSASPLDRLKDYMAQYKPVSVPGLPAFHGGAVGYVSYDEVRHFEKLPEENPDTLGLPDLYFVITDTLVIFDHANNKIKIVSNAHVQDNPDAVYNEASRKISEIEERLRGPLVVSTERLHSAPTEPLISSNFTRESFCEAVEKAREYIRKGEIFQVVLSQRFKREVGISPTNLYRALRCINPSPYMLLLQFPDFALVGSSPEVMTQVKHGRAMVRPIAGTRRRGITPEEDLALEAELLADEKEIAEHVMLVDLGRNDLGRISEPGTVEPVPHKYMVIERYSHVMHIVSEVTGTLKKDCSALDALIATFPTGTVSGAPKIRALEIIEELEPEQRGPYAGACGSISYSGDMDTCILIRTMVVKDGHAYIQAGAGIVHDSNPDKEYEETVNKAKALMKAIDFAEKGLEP